MCQVAGNLLCGALLVDGNQTLLINCVEVYSRFRTIDAHYEHFFGDPKNHSLPVLGSKYENIRITRLNKKLLIGTNTANFLVVSSIRIDTDQIAPEIGPYTNQFVPSPHCCMYISEKSKENANKILESKVYEVDQDEDVYCLLKQVQSKFNQKSTYIPSRFHYIHTANLTLQPYSIFTLADSDTIAESDPLLGSCIFQVVAWAVYKNDHLKKSDIESIAKDKKKKTKVVKAVEAILDLFEDDCNYIEIINNKKLDAILKEIADVIVVNGLAKGNKQVIENIWQKFNSYK